MKKSNRTRILLTAGAMLTLVSLAAWATPLEEGCTNDPLWWWEHFVCLFA